MEGARETVITGIKTLSSCQAADTWRPLGVSQTVPFNPRNRPAREVSGSRGPRGRTARNLEGKSGTRRTSDKLGTERNEERALRPQKSLQEAGGGPGTALRWQQGGAAERAPAAAHWAGKRGKPRKRGGASPPWKRRGLGAEARGACAGDRSQAASAPAPAPAGFGKRKPVQTRVRIRASAPLAVRLQVRSLESLL